MSFESFCQNPQWPKLYLLKCFVESSCEPFPLCHELNPNSFFPFIWPLSFSHQLVNINATVTFGF